VRLAKVKRKVREKLSFSNKYIKGTLAAVTDMEIDAAQRWCGKSES
jgi:hypothetical protein